MERRVLIEGILICLMGLFSIGEGIRIMNTKSIQMMDVLGPGRYNLGLGIVLTALGLIHFLYHRKKSRVKEAIAEKRLTKKMMGMMVVFAGYILLITITGYLIASIVFFILMFRIVGFRSWPSIGGLSLGMSLLYYLIFVQCLSLSFPRGLFFP